MAGRPPTPAQPDQPTPIPTRYGDTQAALTSKLLSLPTFHERLAYLLDEESHFYLQDGTAVTDPAIISARIEYLGRHKATASFIAAWVQHHSGTAISRGAISQMRTGRRPPPRASVANAMADFWRIDPRLLDPSATADRIAESQAEDISDLPASTLGGVTGRTWELMKQIGFQGVRAREVSAVFDATTAEQQLAFLDVLEGIAKHQRDDSDDKS
ncbi:hypothetical protein AB0878_45020 [Amycolatopsis sp. NPDC047767]|uniref:hypothetical protein n=1 Tax=Amycolatopsis sp. NPDC047767 TaxID=3156765 RepID=UPI00345689BC